MDKLLEHGKEILTHLDNGDLMSCYSLFEASVRPLLDELDHEDEFVKLWLKQRDNVDDEDWAAVMEVAEEIRESIDAR